MHTVLRFNFATCSLSRCQFATGRSCLVHLIEKYAPDVAFLPNMLPEGLSAPFKSHGIDVHEYRLRDDLEVDLTDLALAMSARQFKRPVVVIVHYFGYRVKTAGAAALAHEYGGVLLEDCAHCIPNEQDSSCGDVSLYSLNKLIPVVGGAMMFSVNSAVDVSNRDKIAPLQPGAVEAYSQHLLANRILASLGRHELKLAKLALRQSDEAYERYYDIVSHDMKPRADPASIGTFNLDAIRSSRVQIAARYLVDLKSLVFRGGFPHFAFPIRSKNPDKLVDELRRTGIIAARLNRRWRSPPSKFWKSHVLLPLHERMDQLDVDAISKVVKRVERGKNL